MSIGIVGPIVQHFLQGLGMVAMASPYPFTLPQQTSVGTPLVSCGTPPQDKFLFKVGKGWLHGRPCMSWHYHVRDPTHMSNIVRENHGCQSK
jgi:hypothetical protein